MTEEAAHDALLVRPSARGQAPTLLGIAAFFSAYVVLGALHLYPPWLTWLGIVVFGSALLLGLTVLARSTRADVPWMLRLHADGVTVAGHEVTPWTDLTMVRTTGLRPRALFVVSLGYRVVAFVPRAGVQLPLLPRPHGPLLRRADGATARRARRWYGSRLLLLPYAYDVSVTDIEDAVRRFSDVPVVRA